MMKIVQYPHPALTARCEAVVECASVRASVMAMQALLLAVGGLGLSAPQVGITQRFFVINKKKIGKYGMVPLNCPKVFINPVAVEFGKECEPFGEGCLSEPGVTARVIRPVSVIVEALDGNGQSVRVAAKGMLARVLQHEIDHMDGISIFDREKQQGAFAARLAAGEFAARMSGSAALTEGIQ